MVQSHIQEAKRRIIELSRTIEEHNQRYYVADKPTIGDSQYDALVAQLIALEQQYPQFKFPNSPTQRIGTKVSGNLPLVTHQVRMMSLDNTYSKEELAAWEGRVRKGLGEPFELEAELKIDGVSCALVYKDGVLVQAATRGDGITGEDVTHTVRTIRDVPLQLKGDFPVLLEVRGEVYMEKADLKKLNSLRREAGEDPFANPRNAASGALKLLDSKEAAKRRLRFWTHSFGRIEGGKNFTSQSDFLKAAKSFGLPVNPARKSCKNLDQVIGFCDAHYAKRDAAPFEFDGVVVKVNRLSQQERLGATAKSPRWAVAYKFPAYQASTVVKAITVQVGRTGVLTPVAELEPVACAGVMISRATLHNFDEIKRLGVNAGDMVLLERAGDVIPKIIGVSEKRSSGEYQLPEICPSCGGQVVKEKTEEVAYRCLNPECGQRLRRSLEHFASRAAMDIEGLGEAVVDQLCDTGLVTEITDIYDLTIDDLLGLKLFAQKRAENLLEAIKASKKKPLAKFIVALGIPNVGEKAALTLAQHFSSLRAIMDADEEHLMEVDEVGPITARAVVDYFQNLKNKTLMRKFIDAGVGLGTQEARISKGKFAGKKFVFTGELEGMTREEASQMVSNAAGEVVSAVSNKVDYVVAGDNPGSKLAKARQLRVKVLSNKEFKELLNA